MEGGMHCAKAAPIADQRWENSAETKTSDIKRGCSSRAPIWQQEGLDLLKSGAFKFIRPNWSLPEMSRLRRCRPFVHGSHKTVPADSLLMWMCDSGFMATSASI